MSARLFTYLPIQNVGVGSQYFYQPALVQLVERLVERLGTKQ